MTNIFDPMTRLGKQAESDINLIQKKESSSKFVSEYFDLRQHVVEFIDNIYNNTNDS